MLAKSILCIAGLALAAAPAVAQHIEEIPASKAPTVARPDDLFTLPPGHWHMAKHLWQGTEPCSADECEAGFTSGDLVLSVEHSKGYVRIMAGFRNCPPVAFSEIETGTTPGSSARGHVRKQISRVVKGAAKTCKTTAPEVPELNVASMFPGKEAK